MRLRTNAFGILLLFLLISCATSKTYAPSQTSTTQRAGFLENEKINVVFFDSRSEKEKSNEVQNSIFNHLNRTYTSANLSMLDNSKYFSSPADNEITIKINIAGYNAGFGVGTTSGIGSVNGQPFVFNGVSDGKWNGITGIQAIIYDHRNGEQKYSQNISEVTSKPNTGGYSTARKALQTSFQSVMKNLASFIDQSSIE